MGRLTISLASNLSSYNIAPTNIAPTNIFWSKSNSTTFWGRSLEVASIHLFWEWFRSHAIYKDDFWEAWAHYTELMSFMILLYSDMIITGGYIPPVFWWNLRSMWNWTETLFDKHCSMLGPYWKGGFFPVFHPSLPCNQCNGIFFCITYILS